MAFSPRTQTILYQIWAYANPIGWNCNTLDISEELNISVQQVGSVLKCKPDWISRLRTGQRRINDDARLDGRNEHLDLIE